MKDKDSKTPTLPPVLSSTSVQSPRQNVTPLITSSSSTPIPSPHHTLPESIPTLDDSRTISSNDDVISPQPETPADEKNEIKIVNRKVRPSLPQSPLSSITLNSDGLLTVANGKTATPTPQRRAASACSELDLETVIQLSGERPNLKNNLINDLELEHECLVCCSVLRYPVKFDLCEHHCCAACLDELFRFAWRCPVEQRKINKSKVCLDKAFQQQVDELDARCINIGCKWEGRIKDLVVHMDECRHRLVLCPNGCGMMLEKRRVKKHRRLDCSKRTMPCEFCGIDVFKDDELEHIKVCPKFIVPCPNECKKNEVFRENLQFHLEKECPKQEVPCPFVDAGCEFMGQRKQLRKHFKEEPIRHLGLACNFIIEHKNLLEKYDRRLAAMGEKFALLEKKIDILDKQHSSQMIWKIDGFAEKYQLAKLGKKATIYSPQFTTSIHGYSMALSACLFGDGKARGRSMSLFVCICKGDYDALLDWPFRHRVTLTLLDQNSDVMARRNIQHSVKPNVCPENQAFLGRPTAERNASFGVQSFVEIDLMNTLDYIVSDTMFVRCTVDFTNMLRI